MNSTSSTFTSISCTRPLLHDVAHRTVTTQHGRLDLPDLSQFTCLWCPSQTISAGICRRGFIVDTLEDAVTAVRRIASLDRAKVRAEFERDFTAERMASNYLAIYRKLVFSSTKFLRARHLTSGPATDRIEFAPWDQASVKRSVESSDLGE
jgi:hypothetical protein